MHTTLIKMLLFVCLPFHLVEDGKNPKVQSAGIDSSILVLRLGYPPSNLYQRTRVAAQYHFELRSVSGCVVGGGLIDSVERNNTRAYKKLAEINGADWQEKYEKDVQKMAIRDLKMVYVIKKEEFIIRLEKVVRQQNNGLSILEDSIINKDLYRFSVTGYNLDKTPGMSSFARVLVDYRSLKVVQIDSTIQQIENSYF